MILACFSHVQCRSVTIYTGKLLWSHSRGLRSVYYAGQPVSAMLLTAPVVARSSGKMRTFCFKAVDRRCTAGLVLQWAALRPAGYEFIAEHGKPCIMELRGLCESGTSLINSEAALVKLKMRSADICIGLNMPHRRENRDIVLDGDARESWLVNDMQIVKATLFNTMYTLSHTSYHVCFVDICSWGISFISMLGKRNSRLSLIDLS